MKHIYTIDILAERAQRLSYAKISRYGSLVYEVLIEGNTATLKHYETTTLVLDLQDKQVIEWYGESVSDRDSMNTFLHYFDIHDYYFRYGPVMGFIMEDAYGHAYELM